MATTPNEQEIVQAKEQTEQEIEEKRQSQEALGKDFIVSDDGHAAGVVPEDIWQEHKDG